jgi:hypothetical protein
MRHAALRSAGTALLATASLGLALVVTPGAPANAAVADRVLILSDTVTGGSASIEADEAAQQGMSVDIVDGATWSAMTAAQFASYRAIILGDPTCAGPGTSTVAAAEGDAKTWGPAVTGNIVILGTDPVYHATQGGEVVTRRGVDFALAQPGKTGAYITLSCYYHDTAPNTAVPLLDGIGNGGFSVTGVGCYNDAHIVAESPALSGITDTTLSNWSCSVHEGFQTWSPGLVPLAIARDFDSSFTASDGTQGPPYILVGGDVRSFPLSLSPLNDSSPVGRAHLVTATLLDGATRAPVVGASIAFSVTAGPNTGQSGTCDVGGCVTNSSGQVTWVYTSNGVAGTDTIQAFYDINGNGSADSGEPRTTAGMTWTASSGPPVLMIHGIDAVGAAGHDCASYWDDAKSFLRAHGYADRSLLTIKYYEGDQNCDRDIDSYVKPTLGNSYFNGKGAHTGADSGHTSEAAIEHLAYHLAWFIYDEYSKNDIHIEVMAHSMGGLMIRDALGAVQAADPAFPPKLLVDNVVNFGTPHGGARVTSELCDLRLRVRECSEMKAGSAFLTSLEANAWNPQGTGGTDWTAFGSDDDTWVAADRAVGTSRDRSHNMYFGGCHKIWYPATRTEGSGPTKRTFKQPIEHSDYFHDGAIAGGMGADNLLAYTSGSHCGAPLTAHTGQLHPMGWAARALNSDAY